MNLIIELAKAKGCRFVSLLYRSKETGELSEYILAMGVNLMRAYRRDDKVIRLFRPRNELEVIAKDEILTSLQNSIRLGIGNNPEYTCKGVFTHLFNGCQYHPEMKTVYIYGFLIRKKVVEHGEYKIVKSKPLTLVKNELRKRMKINRFRKFEVRFINRIAFNGKVLTLT